jgi:hypothetical protein
LEGVLNDNLGNPIGLAGGTDSEVAKDSIGSEVSKDSIAGGSTPVANTVVPTSVPSASHWLTAGLSKQDTVSRMGSLMRTSRIEKDYLENVPNVEV